MGMTTPYPEPESPELERFTVYSQVEIAATLRRLRDEGSLLTAYFDAEPGFLVTVVLDVNADFEEVVFDYGADGVAQKRLLASKHIVFVGFLEHIKVQFIARVAEATQHDERPAFRIRFPESLVRLQRRDFFRVRPPMSKPAKCLVPYGDDRAFAAAALVLLQDESRREAYGVRAREWARSFTWDEAALQTRNRRPRPRRGSAMRQGADASPFSGRSTETGAATSWAGPKPSGPSCPPPAPTPHRPTTHRPCASRPTDCA